VGKLCGLQSPCDNLRTFAPVVASARDGESVEAQAFQAREKPQQEKGLQPWKRLGTAQGDEARRFFRGSELQL